MVACDVRARVFSPPSQADVPLPPEKPSVLRAERVEVVNAQGMVRAWLGAQDDGSVVLAMRDQEEKVRVLLIADATDTGVVVTDTMGHIVWHAP